MAVTKQQKIEILDTLKEKFKNAKSIGFAQSSTLTVEEFSNLRKQLREVWTSYTLAKKTLIKKALKDALNIEIDLSTIPGQIWVVCSNEDAIAGLWKANDFIKKNEKKISWACSIFEWEVKNLEETKVIAWMPSRETLLSRLVWSMQSPISALARFFDGAAKELETKWVAKVWDLKWAVVEKKVEVKVEEPKAEEVVTEEPKIEETVTPEEKVEEKIEETVAE